MLIEYHRPAKKLQIVLDSTDGTKCGALLFFICFIILITGDAAWIFIISAFYAVLQMTYIAWQPIQGFFCVSKFHACNWSVSGSLKDGEKIGKMACVRRFQIGGNWCQVVWVSKLFGRWNGENTKRATYQSAIHKRKGFQSGKQTETKTHQRANIDENTGTDTYRRRQRRTDTNSCRHIWTRTATHKQKDTSIELV